MPMRSLIMPLDLFADPLFAYLRPWRLRLSASSLLPCVFSYHIHLYSVSYETISLAYFIRRCRIWKFRIILAGPQWHLDECKRHFRQRSGIRSWRNFPLRNFRPFARSKHHLLQTLRIQSWPRVRFLNQVFIA